MVRMRKKEKMRRFSDEQIQRLEVMFESYTKLKSEIIKSEEETAAGGTKICTSTSDGESDYYTKNQESSSSSTKEEEALNMLEEAEENDQLLKRDWGTSCLDSDVLIIYPNTSNNINTDNYQWWDFWC